MIKRLSKYFYAFIITFTLALIGRKLVSSYSYALDTSGVSIENKMDYGGVILIGDSYADGWNPDLNMGNEASSWVGQTINNLGLTNCVSSHLGGTGFVKEKNNENFETLLSNAYNKTQDASSIKWVVVNGGYNDRSSSVNEISYKGNEFVNMAKKYFPNSQIVIGMIGWHNTNADIQSDLNSISLVGYKKVASDNNVLYMNNIEFVLRNKNNIFTSDDVHPNEAGESLIADFTSDFLKKNTVNVVYYKNTSNDKSTKKLSIYVVGLSNQKFLNNVFINAGYMFSGWSINENSNIVSYKSNDNITSDFIKNNNVVNLYAVWTANQYTIKFNDNSGSETMNDVICTYDSSCELPTNSFVKKGYSFAGWANSKNGSIVYTDKAKVKNLTSINNGTVNLYAVWTANQYTIKFNDNSGSETMNDVICTYDSSCELPTNSFVKNGYSFVGWANSKNGSIVYTDKAEVKNLTSINNGTVNLYARWEKSESESDYVISNESKIDNELGNNDFINNPKTGTLISIALVLIVLCCSVILVILMSKFGIFKRDN